MKQRYLEVTFRRGKPFAAYLHLPRTGRGKAVRTADEGHGLRVDFDATGAAMGIEVTNPSVVSREEVNAVLAKLGQAELGEEEWAPASAA
jgi:hypothetical protein